MRKPFILNTESDYLIQKQRLMKMEKEKVMISYRDDLSVLENIDKFAQSRGLDRSNYIRQAMRQFLRQEADALK